MVVLEVLVPDNYFDQAKKSVWLRKGIIDQLLNQMKTKNNKTIGGRNTPELHQESDA